MRKTILILTLITLNALISEAQIRPYISLSSVWGDGGAGLVYKRDDIRYNFNYNFVLEGRDIVYQQFQLSTDFKDYGGGIRLRKQFRQDEYAPFVYRVFHLDTHYPFSIYNELEYRVNNAIYERDYIRTKNVFVLYASDDFKDKFFLRPYAAVDNFINWDDVDIEKVRFHIGYLISLYNMVVRAYYIPWTYGVKEKEWDDRNSFGASISYYF